MYEVLKLGRLHNFTIPCQLDLFDKMVKPDLLYGCELWSYGNCDIIERVHLTFCKMLLHMKSSSPRSWYMASWVDILWRLIYKYA
jgi:hypothetical protein